eukprot:4790042-Prymnesium_polylepis.3
MALAPRRALGACAGALKKSTFTFRPTESLLTYFKPLPSTFRRHRLLPLLTLSVGGGEGGTGPVALPGDLGWRRREACARTTAGHNPGNGTAGSTRLRPHLAADVSRLRCLEGGWACWHAVPDGDAARISCASALMRRGLLAQIVRDVRCDA